MDYSLPGWLCTPAPDELVTDAEAGGRVEVDPPVVVCVVGVEEPLATLVPLMKLRLVDVETGEEHAGKRDDGLSVRVAPDGIAPLTLPQACQTIDLIHS